MGNKKCVLLSMILFVYVASSLIFLNWIHFFSLTSTLSLIIGGPLAVAGLMAADKIKELRESYANLVTALSTSIVLLTTLIELIHRVIYGNDSNLGSGNHYQPKPIEGIALLLIAPILIALSVSAVKCASEDKSTKISANASITALFALGTAISELLLVTYMDARLALHLILPIVIFLIMLYTSLFKFRKILKIKSSALQV